LKVHLGVERQFRPARKAHPAFTVKDLAAMVEMLKDNNVEVDEEDLLPGFNRCYISDPFGNRIELLEPKAKPLLG
jgi:hypothetical protein